MLTSCGFTQGADVELARRVTFRDAVKQAIQQSDLRPVEKLRLRFAMAIKPDARYAIEQFLLDKVAEEGMSIAGADAKIDLGKLEELLQILIKYLPQLIEIISGLFGQISLSATFVYV